VVRFCFYEGYVKYQHKDDKSPLKWAWSASRDHFKFWRPSDIFETAEGIVKCGMQADYQILAYGDKPPLIGSFSQSHDPIFNFSPNHIVLIGEARHFKFRVLINTRVHA